MNMAPDDFYSKFQNISKGQGKVIVSKMQRKSHFKIGRVNAPSRYCIKSLKWRQNLVRKTNARLPIVFE